MDITLFFDYNHIHNSFLFRELPASLLRAVILFLYPVKVFEQNSEIYDNVRHHSGYYFECGLYDCRDLRSDSIVAKLIFYDQRPRRMVLCCSHGQVFIRNEISYRLVQRHQENMR